VDPSASFEGNGVNTVAVILARGGSKGIPRKNLVDFCGKPLIVWTIEQCLAAQGVDSVWVSSDSKEILVVARSAGARAILRPDNLSGDTATSESGWLHALGVIDAECGPVDLLLAPQATSPLREPQDIERGLDLFASGQFDSLFSCSMAEDIYFWQRGSGGQLESINYDWRNRKRRQDHAPQYIENGSFYMFQPNVLRNFNNRFGERIGMVEMEFWKTFEIDSPESLRLCAALMREFLLRG
jgi:CMP-N,N'-diacetyllegionaminic acid synthase